MSEPGAEKQKQALARAQGWAARRSHAASEYPAERVAGLTGERQISVVIPARSVAATIGDVVRECVALEGIVDEVLVIDADSPDDTGALARAAGATVHQEESLLPQYGPVLGKGDAMWRGLSVARGEIVVFVDGDTEGFSGQFVTGLLGPLLEDPSIRLVKGAFKRPFTSGQLRVEDAGGRVNELAAKPLINIFFPELAAVGQPLAGEFAARRDALEQLPFCTGYGTEIQLLVDFYLRFGLDAIAQVNLGERINRHQPLSDLGVMSFAVMRALLARVSDVSLDYGDHEQFLQQVEGELRARDVALTDRPPVRVLEPTRAGAIDVTRTADA